MKERLLNVLKWFLIALGALFLVQLLIVVGVILGITNFSKPDFSLTKNTNKNLKEIKPIIEYVENYKNKNGVYPERIENIKVKPNLYFKYELNKDASCYTITTKNKKDNLTKQYQHCKSENKNSSASTESYVEYSD